MIAAQMKRAARLAPEAARDTAQHSSNDTPDLSDVQDGTALNARHVRKAVVAEAILDTVLSQPTPPTRRVGQRKPERSYLAANHCTKTPPRASYAGDGSPLAPLSRGADRG